ncbi:UDP-N-acetylmuramoylalanine--D-glutamate ligase [Cyanobium sp. PCC 7001]|uniref:UDP-N-acetylmuramoyl-L-alanine--D-glutamate ligase n=1 Tax=Cyanobium sp. PCC 7001 TaxID=180281 RepID=UPI00018048E1|nr:UDP-N-acetylmuramoyl-L-alanine--D-glutamate ligase [Cyanobium sp. PCC 7001]EDY37918.1 UDP-N-acetylmuramoylalanine--D-glutamate ligase [Cyanobium sp. PCC 7001]
MPTPALDASVVVGIGRSGSGAARLLRSLGQRVCLIDSSDTPEAQRRAEDLRQLGIDVRLGVPLDAVNLAQLQEQLPGGLQRLIISPGIPWDLPALTALRSRGVRVQGEMVPAWEASRPVPWIGITGTNGKTTVTHLVHHLLEASGLDAPMAGNVGYSAAELVLDRRGSGAELPTWMVVELSSYQIEAAPEVAPRVGIWTTLTPDHLERHGTLEAYRAIKRSLLERSQVQVLNGDDPDLQRHAASWPGACWVTAGPRQELPEAIRPHLWVEAGRVIRDHNGTSQDLMAADCLAMPGEHNRQNMMLAIAAGLEAGLTGQQMECAFRSFPGVPHRLERIDQQAGVSYYNDSKATNYDAAEVAVRALAGPLVVLAGGQAKRGEARGWLEALHQKARAVVLFGAAQAEFQALLEGASFAGAIHRCDGLNEAVPLARALAAELHCRAVLLSPACASFDQYTDFEARGEHFRSLVLALRP